MLELHATLFNARSGYRYSRIHASELTKKVILIRLE